MQLVELAFFTGNVDGMAAFYQKLLGEDPVARSPDMAIFMVGGTKIFIHKTYEPSEGDLPPDNHIAFSVGDLEATSDRLEGLGVPFEAPPQDYYWGRSAYLRDPDGNQIEIIKSDPESQG